LRKKGSFFRILRKKSQDFALRSPSKEHHWVRLTADFIMKRIFQLTACALMLAGPALLAATNEIDLKSFLANTPPIHDLAAVIEQWIGTNIQKTYYYLCWQEGDFVTLQSSRNQMVLEGMTDQTDGMPDGVGKFGQYYWFFYGWRNHMSVFEWEGVETNSPPDIALRVAYRREHPVNHLLTLGCNLAPAGGFYWEGNRAHISLINKEIDAELLFRADGRAQEMRYRLRNPGPKGQKDSIGVQWFFMYEYVNPEVPHRIPSRITRYIIAKGKWHTASRIELCRLVLAKDRMTREDFLPSQFISPKAILVPGRFEADKTSFYKKGKWIIETPRKRVDKPEFYERIRKVYFIFAVAALLATAILLQRAVRKTKT
jgi:hypothetical protein